MEATHSNVGNGPAISDTHNNDNSNKTMRAVVYEQYGEPKDVLQVRDDWPRPKPDGYFDVVVRVHAAAINPVDYKFVEGFMSLIQFSFFPFVPGFDFAGVIVETGSAVKGFRKGDEVMGMAHFTKCGAFAEYICISSSYITFKPPNISFAEAASVPLAGLTSYQALLIQSKAEASQKVLVIGGSGGTGMFGIQLAKHFKCHVATVCSGKNADFVRELGADQVIDYTTDDWGVVLAGHNYDIIYDCVGGKENYEKSLQVLKPNGYYTTIAGDKQDKFTLGAVLSIGSVALGRKVASWIGKAPVYSFFTAESKGDQLAVLANLLERGELKTHIAQSFTIDEAVPMFEAMMTQRTRGKLIMQIVPEEAGISGASASESTKEGESLPADVSGEGI